MSLALPVSGNSKLKRLLHNHYEDTVITYECPQCSKEGESFRKTIIQKIPPILIFHLNRFEYAISAKKKQNCVDFPVESLSLRAHILSDKPSASYSLCGVSNHFDNLSGGHHTSYCRPSCGNVWYNWDDRNVTKLRTPVKTSAAYLLSYNSLQKVWVLLLVPMILILLWCEPWGGWVNAWCLWVGRCWVGRGGWIDAWPVVGMVDGSSQADECGLLSALVLSLYFPYPFCPCISHTHWTNCLPYFPYPFMPLIFHNNDTSAPTAWCWELLFYVAPSGWLLISPLKCFWPVCLGYLMAG